MSAIKVLIVVAVIFGVMHEVGYEPTMSEIFLGMCIVGAGFIASPEK